MFSDDIEVKELSNHSSFSANLFRGDFKRFQEEMNKALEVMNSTLGSLCNWEDLESYRIFMALSFGPIGDYWEVTIDANETTSNRQKCHLMMPKDDASTNKTCYLLSYGVSESQFRMREMAAKGVLRMYGYNLGEDLRVHVPEARLLYRIFIAFHGPAGIVEHRGPTVLRPPEYFTTTSKSTSATI